jgi:hypothetical protein
MKVEITNNHLAAMLTIYGLITAIVGTLSCWSASNTEYYILKTNVAQLIEQAKILNKIPEMEKQMMTIKSDLEKESSRAYTAEQQLEKDVRNSK